MPDEQPGAKRKIPPTVIDIVVAVAIVASILIGMFIYTGIWPPLVVVESKSMQHSADESSVGTIDTGDLVLVKKVSDKFDITTYLEGKTKGYRSYGDFGDVIVYKRGGSDERTPIIHRAVIYLTANEDGASFRAPSLQYLVRGGGDADYDFLNDEDTWERITGTIRLYGYGYTNMVLNIKVGDIIAYMLHSDIPLHDGFITKGDFNSQVDQEIGTSVPREPVEIDWVIGKARGEIPWFGILKLWATGTLPADAPDNSIRNLALLIGVIIAIPVAVELFFWQKERRGGPKNAPPPDEATTDMERAMGTSPEESENVGSDEGSTEPLEDEPPT
mgnify:CR=1 FL=1